MAGLLIATSSYGLCISDLTDDWGCASTSTSCRNYNKFVRSRIVVCGSRQVLHGPRQSPLAIAGSARQEDSRLDADLVELRKKCFAELLASSLQNDQRFNPPAGTERDVVANRSFVRRDFLRLPVALLCCEAGRQLCVGRSDAEAAQPQKGSPAATQKPSSPVTLGKILSNKLGFSFFYPDGFIVATNRKGDEGRQADGSQAVVLVGNFSTFETISVIRYSMVDTSALASPQDLAKRLLSSGNVRTDYVSAGQREAQPAAIGSEGIHYDFEYVTEVCRGALEEGRGGVPDCVSAEDGSLLKTVKRHHIASIVAREGEFYVVSASASENRWSELSSALRASVSSFFFA